MSYSPEIENAASQWLVHHRATSDPRTLALIVQRAQQLVEELGGVICPAFFERAYLELTNEGVIAPFRGSLLEKPAEQAIPQDVINYIERTSAYELQRRYKTDATFRAHYDAYSKAPKQQAQVSATLSVEEYNRLPAAQIARRYQSDRSFRAQVDSLISRGLI
jgi:hypothetical protein